MDITLIIPAAYAAQLDPFHPDGAERAAVAALRLYLDLGLDAVQELQARAAEKGIKPAEVIKDLLAEPTQAPATTITANPPKTPRTRKTNEARDKAIADEYLAGGITYPVLAAKYGLSIIRVTQIVANARARARAAAENSGNNA